MYSTAAIKFGLTEKLSPFIKYCMCDPFKTYHNAYFHISKYTFRSDSPTVVTQFFCAYLHKIDLFNSSPWLSQKGRYQMFSICGLGDKCLGIYQQQIRHRCDCIDSDGKIEASTDELKNMQEGENQERFRNVLSETQEKKVKSTGRKSRQHAVKPPQVVMNNCLNSGDVRPVSTSEIKDFLQKRDISFSDGYTCYITTCPRFIRRKMNMKQMNKMFINMTTGYFVCLSCKKNGTWHDFVDNTDTLLRTEKGRLPECFSNITLHDVVKESSKAKQIWDSCITVEETPEDDLQMTKQFLGIEHLDSPVLEKYQVRFFKEKAGIALPHFGLDGSLSGLRTIAEEVATSHGQDRVKAVTRTYPMVDFHGLFGVNIIDNKHNEVVLTITEFDAMAIQQATGVLALALPKGDSILPQKVLPLLEQFKKITLWFGGDMKVWESAKQFSKKLNPNRCYLVRPDETQPAPLVALKRDLKLKSILKDAQPVQHKSITSFRHLRQDVFNELAQAEQVSGIKWKRYPQLNKLLKGHRRGELTVITGPTGSGKTTFISDYSLDLCMQGVNTLWGSFEINNVRLMKTMLVQYAEKNLTKHLDMFDYWADQFQQLPMYMMTFHGQENIYNVIETMSHAVYVHDIAHVIVDNLQFMMGSDYGGSGANAVSERFMKQDQIVGAFRKFATNKNCHVTLVIHPRKERDSDELTISSIFGGAKASQEADNVLIIQDRRAVTMRGRKYLQVAKNRFDGDLGIMMLKFDKETLRYNVSSAETKKTASKNKSEDKTGKKEVQE